MNSTAYRVAREFYQEEWGDKRIEFHSACVIEECLERVEGDLIADVFAIAGWLHDIGRKIDEETHHELGLGFVEKLLQQHPEYSALRADIRDSVLHHRRSGHPATRYGEIMQWADKAALKDDRWIAFEQEREKH